MARYLIDTNVLHIHGVAHLLTFNGGDFQPYGIVVVSPEQV